MFTYRELTTSARDRAVLERFYSDLYVKEFPDPDERETLENMLRYLELKEEGWYGPNNYHILVAENDGTVAAASMSDYLAEPNAGVIEFLVTGIKWRSKGLGRHLLSWTEQTLDEDAWRSAGSGVRCVVAEMNDPFRPSGIEDSLDPFARAGIWGRWGYKKIEFPYVQPALSKGQHPVEHLLLMARPLVPEVESGMPAALVEGILREYMRWAMRIENPEADDCYRAMAAYLEKAGSVPLTPLLAYVGSDETKPIVVREITGDSDPDLEPVLDLYEEAFPEKATSIAPNAFRRLLEGARSVDLPPHAYHLWSLRTEASHAVSGMVSFFTFPAAGFGGYIALAEEVRGKGRLRPLVARIERTMIEDGLNAHGWYVECASDTAAAIFRRVGFYEVDAAYRQPALNEETVPVGSAALLRLMYKPFGSVYGKPRIPATDFLNALESIYRIVYGIASPRTSPFFRYVEKQLQDTSSETLPLK